MNILELLTLDSFGTIIKVTRTVLIVVLVFILFNFVFNRVKKLLLSKVQGKKHKSNVEIFAKLLKYLLFLIVILIAIFSYSGSLTGLGIGIGLFSAALGWALQKPITGIAGWVMIVIKRPFDIGDRIIVGDVRGDVEDITLTHIYLKEVGGIVAGEEKSGRIIMVPNSTIFEKNIINYTLQDEYVLDQVIVMVTYESDLDKAIGVVLNSAKKHIGEFIKVTNKEPTTRTYFQSNGVNIHIRYFVQTSRIAEISSNITQEIHKNIMKTKNVEIAYPHMDLIYSRKR